MVVIRHVVMMVTANALHHSRVKSKSLMLLYIRDNQQETKGMFTWRRASSLSSPTKRAEFYHAFTWEKPDLLPGLARLAESPGLTTFIVVCTKL